MPPPACTWATPSLTTTVRMQMQVSSSPAYEFAESEAKARGVLRAVELAMEQPDWP